MPSHKRGGVADMSSDRSNKLSAVATLLARL